MLLFTRTTLNIESYMGAIMAVAVGTANAILLVLLPNNIAALALPLRNRALRA